jgi:uncharacterized ParB-like nuclease family protein
MTLVIRVQEMNRYKQQNYGNITFITVLSTILYDIQTYYYAFYLKHRLYTGLSSQT